MCWLVKNWELKRTDMTGSITYVTQIQLGWESTEMIPSVSITHKDNGQELLNWWTPPPELLCQMIVNSRLFDCQKCQLSTSSAKGGTQHRFMCMGTDSFIWKLSLHWWPHYSAQSVLSPGSRHYLVLVSGCLWERHLAVRCISCTASSAPCLPLCSFRRAGSCSVAAQLHSQSPAALRLQTRKAS